MRVLQVRFKNLNSLVGEWLIDFAHPAYTGDGIFAITGPTGAGKSTILDAICLALYGRTPRLSRVTKASNELMSRQQGECLAEVTFQAGAGVFRCCWGQHRSRRKAGGELQNPRHEIVDADSGAVIANSLRGVAEQVETVTGMDFERFTRSMLLAQGGFAAFLQAAPDQRAPLLEQITGTEIYSEISVRVHEIRAAEQKKLEALSAGLDGTQPMAADEERDLGVSLEAKTGLDSALAETLGAVQRAIDWQRGIGRLEEELQALGQALQALQRRRDAFAPEQARLEAANRALELAADYADLTALRKQRASWEQALELHRRALPAQEADTRRGETAVEEASAALAATRQRQQQLAPILRQVRELDLGIAALDKTLADLSRELDEAMAQQQQIVLLQDQEKRRLGEQRQALQGLTAALLKGRGDASLVHQLAGLEQRFGALKKLHALDADARLELDGAKAQRQRAEDHCQQQAARLEAAGTAHQARERALEQKQAELVEVLGGESLGSRRSACMQLLERQHRLARAGEAASSLHKAQKQLSDVGAGREQRITAQAQQQALRQLAAQRRQALEREIDLLETQRDLMEKVASFSEARLQLADGEACPLCGALDHPYARGNLPAADGAAREQDAAKKQLRAVMGELGDLDVDLARIDSELDNLAADEAQLRVQIDSDWDALESLAAALSLGIERGCSGEELLGMIDPLQTQVAQALTREKAGLDSADALELAASALRQALEASRLELGEVEASWNTSRHELSRAEELMQRLQLAHSNNRDQLQQALIDLQQHCRAYGLETLVIEELDAAYTQLAARRERWLQRESQRAALEQEIHSLELQLVHRGKEMDQLAKAIIRLQQQLAEREDERGGQLRQRRLLFDDRDPEREEASLEQERLVVEQRHERARQALGESQQKLQKLQATIDKLETDIAATAARLNASRAGFVSQLAARGFRDENHYLAACLDRSEREALALRAQELANETTATDARAREKSAKLTAERGKRLDLRPLAALETEERDLQQRQRDLQQDIGAIRQRLLHNDRLKQQHRERMQAIEAQGRENARWDRLHQLIGSADGKKFRNFAQGLTFELMMGHANAQLQKMTDRYLLVRDQSQPLELNVLDNYQAGEIRSTKNLSGGESFIVSLALALGLSHMASKRVRVDSLFLDEGFGTLDDEALDIALETLVGLQRDGKLIGVISHVSALKERIATQIKVMPRAGGKSEIDGPGCARLG